MALESATYIDGLNANNPVNLTDIVGEGDDHIRLLKSTILNSFPNIAGAMTLSHTQINDLPRKDTQNTFTHLGTRRSAPIIIENDYPDLAFYETNAGADAKGWDFIAEGGEFQLRTHTDAGGAGEIPLTVLRSGTVVTDIRLDATRVVMRGGADLQIFDSSNSDNIQIDHDGTDANIRFPDGATTDLNIDVAQQLSGQIKVFADTHLVSGSRLQIRDATNNDYVEIYHDGTNAIFDFDGVSNVQFGNSAAPAAYYKFNNTAAEQRLVLQELGGDTAWFRASDTQVEIRSLQHGAMLALLGEDAGGTTRFLFTGDPDGKVGLYYDAVETLRTASRADGGALVYDRSSVALKVGFRNPQSRRSLTANDDLEQDDEGQIVRATFTTNDREITLPQLLAGTQITVVNRSSSGIDDCIIKPGTGVTVLVMGGNTQYNNTGEIRFERGTVMHAQWETTTIVNIWGGGLSRA